MGTFWPEGGGASARCSFATFWASVMPVPAPAVVGSASTSIHSVTRYHLSEEANLPQARGLGARVRTELWIRDRAMYSPVGSG